MRTIRPVAWTMACHPPGANSNAPKVSCSTSSSTASALRACGMSGEEERWKLELFVRHLPKLTRMKSSRRERSITWKSEERMEAYE